MRQARIFIDGRGYQGESMDETVDMPPDQTVSFHVYGDGQSARLLFGDEPIVIVAEINIKSHLERILSHLRKGHITASRIVIDFAETQPCSQWTDACIANEIGRQIDSLLPDCEDTETLAQVLAVVCGNVLKQMRNDYEAERRRLHAQHAADVAALAELYAALELRQQCTECGGSGTRWTLVEEEAEPDACDCWDNAHQILEKHKEAA